MKDRTEPKEAKEGSDYDVKRSDLAQYFAPFGRRQMPDKTAEFWSVQEMETMW